MDSLQLVILSGDEEGKAIPIRGHKVQLGRAAVPGAEAPGWIFFADRTVSRVHAMLSWDHKARAYTLHHRSETNLTEVNGKQIIRGTVIRPGDWITLGRLTLKVEKAEEPPHDAAQEF